MKFEKLNESNGKSRKMFLYGLITGVGLLIIFNLFLTKAKYKVVDSAKLVNSTISYSNADFSLISLNVEENNTDEPVEEENKKYKPSDTVPTDGNYTLNENKSYCTARDDKQLVWGTHDDLTKGSSKIEVKFEDGSLTFSKVTEKNTKCYLWLDKEFKKVGTAEGTLADLYKSTLSVNEDITKCPEVDPNTGQPTLPINSTYAGEGVLCKGYDDDGETYYFRGAVDNNWVRTDSTYWRIVRINGNGTIRLIYSGNGSAASSGDETMALTNQAFNDKKEDNTYVGYMYGEPSQKNTNNDETAYNDTHNNSSNSSILNNISLWYFSTNFPMKVKGYLDENAGFCGDRTPYASSSEGSFDKKLHGWGTKETYYGSYIRIEISKKPTFKCSQIEQDLYTTINSQRGNKKLPVPVGLITADEVMFAGGVYSKVNTSYYLYTNTGYWTMSPILFNSSAEVFDVSNLGGLGVPIVTNNLLGVRPVINLKADTPFESGNYDGTSDKPFTVKLN